MRNIHLVIRRVIPLLACALVITSSCSWDPLGSYLDSLKPPLDDRHPRFELSSASTGATYVVYVRLPVAGSGPYPVLYYLDADSASGRFCHDYDRMESDGRVVPAILVGVGYGDVRSATSMRNRDLTPAPTIGAPPPGEWGGASAFADFLVAELIPEVEKRFPASTSVSGRAIFGHSLGGLFVGWFAFNRPGHFRGYCTASPSFSWDSGAILEDEAAYAGANTELAVDWHFGGTDGKGPNLYAQALIEKLRSRAYPSLNISAEWYHTGIHGTSWRDIYPEAAVKIFPAG